MCVCVCVCVQEINSVFFGRSLNKEDKEMCEQLLKQLDNFDKLVQLYTLLSTVVS